MLKLQEIDNLILVKIQNAQKQIHQITQTAKTIPQSRKKFIAQRRLLMKRHIRKLESRRSRVMERMLQLETMHLNDVQVRAFDQLAKAYKNITKSPEDVEKLIDKLENFSTDFENISDILNEDIEGKFEITDDEIEKELQNLNADTIDFPEVPTGYISSTKTAVQLEVVTCDS